MASALEQRINGVDWESLLRRCVRRLGWSGARANDVLAAYQQFLELKINTADFDASILSPPLLVDEMWHLHVLDTKRYKRDCEAMVGRRGPATFIHHDADGDEDTAARNARVAATKLAYRSRFGEAPPLPLWSFDAGEAHASGGACDVLISMIC